MEGLCALTRMQFLCGQLGRFRKRMTPLEHIAPADLGERLRLAREAAGITQADAAGVIDVGRTTLIAIEQGQRRIRMSELQKLARTYGTSVNAVFRQEAIQ